ncbi:MAG: 4-alpha-glucanotransferase, partial [Treponemataceae bacterium]|nr:4-alpha-glucanotransferase [Treponemataceae bacterium]
MSDQVKINKRASGILLHPTSLPGTPGIGTLGEKAYKFVDWLKEAKQSLWQILPIGPTGYGDSPYSSFSTFAGNHLLIDLDLLVKNGFLSKEEANPPEYINSRGYIDFGAVVYWKNPVLKTAARHFLAQNKLQSEFATFCKENEFWLETYAT